MITYIVKEAGQNCILDFAHQKLNRPNKVEGAA